MYVIYICRLPYLVHSQLKLPPKINACLVKAGALPQQHFSVDLTHGVCCRSLWFAVAEAYGLMDAGMLFAAAFHCRLSFNAHRHA